MIAMPRKSTWPTSSSVSTKVEACRFFGIGRPAFDDWIKRGAPVIRQGNKETYDLLAIVRWRVQSAKTEPTLADLMRGKLKLQIKATRQRYQELASDLVTRTATRRGISALLKRVQQRVERLSGEIVAAFPEENRDNDCAGIVRHKIRMIQRELATAMPQEVSHAGE